MNTSVIFPNVLCIDLDGPIINCIDRYYEVYKRSIIELEGNPMPKGKFWEQKRNKINENSILEQSKVKKIYHQSYYQFKLSMIEDERYLDMDSLQPKVHQILPIIKNNFQKLILITLRRNNDALKKQLHKLGINKYFDYILSTSDVEIPQWKVKVNLYLSNMPAEYLSGVIGFFIGDTETDILAGKQIGLKTIAVLSGIRSREILERYNPDYILDDLSDFAVLLQRMRNV